jgi:hypothetical protein
MTMRPRVRRPNGWLAVCASAILSAGWCGDPATAAITLDADFDSGSLDEVQSSVAGNVVTLAGRDNFNPGQWKWLYFSASGVAGQQVTFRIDDDFATGGGNLVGHKMVYSYDRENWAFFDNNVRLAEQDLFMFFNNQPFTEDQAYVAYGLPHPNSRIEGHAASVASSPWVRPTATGNASLVIGQSPGGVDDLGRVVAPRDIYAYTISDSSSTTAKAKVALVGGVHANETLGNFTLEGLVDYLLGDTLEAAVLRKRAEFFVYPMVNPDGRFAGYNRSTVQQESLDPNRFWAPPDYGGLDDIRVVGEALRADTAEDVDFLIDFHSDVAGKTGHYGNVLPVWQSHPLWLNLLQVEPAVQTNNALLIDDTTAKFGRDVLDAEFSITFETQFLADENVDRFVELGRNWGRALFKTLNVFADLNLDGLLDGRDWLLQAAGAETDLAGLAPIDAYRRGDLDGDGVNSALDFGLFKDAYEQLHGSGSFAAMLASVPEPGCALLALSAVFFCACGLARRRHVTIARCPC